MFRDYRTRKQKLRDTIIEVLKDKEPNVNLIVKATEEFESDNLNTIKKLKRKKTAVMNRINGAIKQSFDAHPVVTRELIGSIGKRIYGSLLELEDEENRKISIRDIFIGFGFGVLIMVIILLIFK